MPSLAVVIPAYRSERTIRRCVLRFREEAPDAAIVVVDSHSAHASATAVEDVAGTIVVRAPARLLPHAARNEGARRVAADLLLFTDPDVYPRAGAVDRLVAARAAHGGVAVAAVACHGEDPVDVAAHVAKYGRWLPRTGVALTGLAPTSGLLIQRSLWSEQGGIPEEGILGDTAFSWRLRDAGIELLLVGDAVFEHDHGTTARALVGERFARGRAFAPLRSARWPGATARALDVVTTLSLVRPARSTIGATRRAWRALGRPAALRAAPLVAAAEAAWFMGELAGQVDRIRARAGS